MKSNFLYLLSFAMFLLVGLSMSSCENKLDPEASITISEVTSKANSITFKLTPTNATKYEYTVITLGSESTTPTIIEGNEAKTITVNVLEPNTKYEIKATAYASDGKKSAIASETITTRQATLDIVIKNVIQSDNSVTFTIMPYDATEYHYAVTPKGSEGTFIKVAKSTGETFTVEGLTLATAYEIKAYAVKGSEESDIKMLEFYVAGDKVITLTSPSNTADVGSEITFTVKYGETVITEEANVFLKDGTAIEGGKFTFNVAGDFIFYATYGGYKSADITINAEMAFDVNLKYKRNTLITKFTGVWCQYCPGMTASLKTIAETGPIIVHAIHVGQDPFKINEGQVFYNYYGVTGVPVLGVNYVKNLIGSGIAQIMNGINSSINTYPTVSAVSINSTVVDNKIKISGHLGFQTDGKYKVGCIIVENDLRASGSGSTNGIYDAVTRSVPSGAMGQEIGDKTAGMLETFSFEVPQDASWNIANCEVIVYIFKEYGDKYIVNNAAKCSVNGFINFVTE